MSCRLMPQYAKHMKRDPSGKGYIHLGSDGVLRTISGNDEVLDARGLDPEQIENILKVMPAGSSQREDFRDVDGTKVTSHEALFHPAAGVLPPKRGVDEQKATEK
ncbi:hypothetical protein PENSTE_c017G02578 [Penicillium steckii]|uniref:Uncharacterized protein n=1 Tax=Penicillium steckii TaxID=303698 RepID=A0A1V6SXD6_9EURO|nr:hypothetical protein PENSTE_c017G02578 [Penicillium steckii]